MRAGFVAIVGLPNVGKSTLMNRILGQKIAIVAPRPQTTRNRILGVKNLDGAQLVLVDTPGLHGRLGGAVKGAGGSRGRSPLGRYMIDEATAAVEEVDALLWVVEAPEGGAGARRIAERGFRVPPDEAALLETLSRGGKPIVLAINKVDRLGDKRALLPVLDAWSKAHAFAAMVPISATAGQGIDQLSTELVAVLPEGERLFPEEMLTDRAERWLAAEFVREQVFQLTRQEVPYAVAVTIDTFEERPGAGDRPADVMIEATIHVEKEAQKRIVVGDGGRMVREIGTRARAEIGQLLDCPVHLKLFVRVDEEWTGSPAGIRSMGYE
jgi:GTP-binding protein Era